ncbi:MAG TPA: DUF134 domain-containing protein [Candidatus Aenigmarchaeota archaeon]|nr:DUF134 domain-containing protein [Candidatus Aenigmarchaeota archaeon]
MPRPRRLRRVCFRPRITCYRPEISTSEEIVLTIDEFEAIRLRDYENLAQIEAAERMHISQPTFQRIYKSAREKIADAIVNGKIMRIEGGPCKLELGFRRRIRRRHHCRI